MATITELVEPLVTTGGAVPETVRTDATRLLDAQAVTLEHVGERTVTARVEDDDGAHRVALGATVEGLASRCDCERGSTGLVCGHALATAVVAWTEAGSSPGR